MAITLSKDKTHFQCTKCNHMQFELLQLLPNTTHTYILYSSTAEDLLAFCICYFIQQNTRQQSNNRTDAYSLMHNACDKHSLTFRPTVRYVSGQIPSLAVFHYNVQSSVGVVDNSVIVTHYVLMFKLPQQVDLLTE